MNLTLEQIRGLAELERKMDSGEQPYVKTDHGRLAVDASIMSHFGLQSGQTVSAYLVSEILRANLARMTRLMDEAEAREKA